MKIKKTEVTNSSIPIPNGFKQTDIGLIPEDWDLKKIKDAFSFTKKPRTLEIDGISEIPFIPMELIPDNKIYVEEFELKRFDSFSSGTYFENGNVLLAKITPSFENGKQAIAKIPYDFGYATTEVIPINELKDVSSKFFLFNYLLKSDVRKTLAGKMEGSTGRQRLPKTVLQDTLIPLPPLPEQKKIAHVLSKIQQAIETQEQIIKTTQELKKALMQKLFTEGLNGEPQKQTEIGPIPESWEVIELENTGDVVYGIQASVAHLKKPIGLPILTNKNITLAGEIDLSELNYFELKTKRHFATILNKGDILFNWRSGSKEHVGKTAYFDLDGEYVHSSFILRIRPKPDVNNKYLFYYLTYLRLSEYFIKLHSFSINAKFNKSAVNKLPTALPDPSVQEKIATFISNIDMKIKIEENKFVSLKNLFSTTLNNLMTGQIRVKDIEFKLEETAEAVEGV